MVSVPPSSLIEVTPRDVNLVRVDKDKIMQLAVSEDDVLFWAMDAVSLQNLERWSKDKDLYIIKANAEIKYLRLLLEKALDRD